MKTLKDYLAETIRRYGAVGSSPGMGYTVEDAAVKYGVFAKGGSVGSQRFRDDPLKTFDTKEEAIADARRRRSGLSKGERGYYRMSYIVKPIKGVSEGPDKGWVPNPDNPGYYIHRSDLPQTGKVSDPAKAKLSRIINKYFGQIYDYGDGDESLNYLDNNAPLWFDLFDKHDGDIDAIIANEPADVLKQAALELKNVANDLKYELDESENLNEFLAPDGSNYGGGGGGDEPRQFRVIITLYDDSSAEDETAERKIGITVTATSEKAACDLATTMLLKSPRYDGSRITNVTARPVLDEQTMSRAAKGYEKYGRAGIAALAKARREGRALDPVRDRYDQYNEGSAGDVEFPSALWVRSNMNLNNDQAHHLLHNFAKQIAAQHGLQDKVEKIYSLALQAAISSEDHTQAGAKFKQLLKKYLDQGVTENAELRLILQRAKLIE